MAALMAYLRSHHVGLLALFIALGGTAYAASLPKNSVGSKQLKKGAVSATKLKKAAVTTTKIKKNSITAAKVKNKSLVASDFKTETLPKGPKGDPGGLQSTGFVARQPASPEPQPSGANNPGVLNLDVPAGSPGLISASGVVRAPVPSRLIANASVVLVNNTAASRTFRCRLALLPVGTSTPLPFAAQSDTVAGPSAQVALPISGGTDVAAGTYNVRVQCYSGIAASGGIFSFVRGGLTVSLAPR